MLFDRDVGGALAAAVLMIAGALIGPLLATAVVRRVFQADPSS
jgi:hypothetical protein